MRCEREGQDANFPAGNFCVWPHPAPIFHKSRSANRGHLTADDVLELPAAFVYVVGARPEDICLP